jgi:uncharacterized protein (DUF58 family)
MRARTGESRPAWTAGAILTHDYFPRLAPALRWLWSPLGSLGTAAFAAMLCGLILHPRGFVVLFGLLVVMALGVMWPWIAVLGLSGALGFEQRRTREGKGVTVQLSLRNRMPWGAWGLVVEDGCRDPGDGGESDAAAWGVVCAAPLRTTQAAWEFIPACRGIYPLQVARITCGFPFGIWEATRPLGVSSRLVVWPRTFPVAPIPEAAGQKDFEGSAPRDRPGPAGDFLGVRPYRRGDSLRRIHWPQTARHDQLVVCELERPAAPSVQVVLDLHDDAHAGSGPESSREWAIRVAASFLEQGIEQGADVEAVFGGRVIAPRAGPLSARRARIFDALAGIESEGTWTLADLLELPACRRAKVGLRVIVTTDLGLRRSFAGLRQRTGDRLVVLKAAAFARPGEMESDEGAPRTPPACWIWIDDPARVPQCVQRAWKEVALGC